MNKNLENFLRAYMDTYHEFYRVYVETLRGTGRPINEMECTKLFEIAMNDSLMGEMLKNHIWGKITQMRKSYQAEYSREIEQEVSL